jgi:hypothetical protein
MFYIHQTACISPQQTFSGTKIDLLPLHGSVDNKLHAREPPYTDIPEHVFRRMAKPVRMGIGAALPLLQPAQGLPDGIIIGTANAGMEESLRFLQQIIVHEEGMLTPWDFVQSTPNTTASQISFLTLNKGYNITHVQNGLASENALLDAGMLVRENPLNTYLIGAVDEIGPYNYNIDFLEGWFKKEPLSSTDLYRADSPGSLAGEGSAMFLVNNKNENALAKLRAITMLHTDSTETVQYHLRSFLDAALSGGEKIDLMLSGENGDNRLRHFFCSCEAICEEASGNDVTIARFKHMCGEYPTASAFAFWLACFLAGEQAVPEHMIKKQPVTSDHTSVYENILIYNTCKGGQHSFILVSRVEKML